MKHTRWVVLIFIGILLVSSILPQSMAQKKDRLIDKILIRFFKYTYSNRLIPGFVFNPFITPWKIFRLVTPDLFTATPSTVDIEYLNQTEIIIGVKDPETGGYQRADEKPIQPLFPSEYFTFKLEIPEEIPKDALVYTFDPPMIKRGEKTELKTKLTIISNIPKNVTLAKNLVFRVNVTKWQVASNLWLPPKESRGLILGTLRTGRVGYIRITWLLAASKMFGTGFGWLSGKLLIAQTTYIDIMVKINRFHLAKITPPPPIEIRPNQLVSIPIEIQNLGSHVDSFNFEVNTTADTGIKVSAPPTITLAPGEIGHTSIEVASSLRFHNPGTVQSINIKAYSVYQPEKTFNSTIILTTRGIYISETSWVYLIVFWTIILVGVAIFFYRVRRKLEKICKKPEKPWDLPEEKKHLEKLKKENKEKYIKTLQMMREEYISALLWYRSYQKAMIKKIYKKKISPELSRRIFSRFNSMYKQVFKKKEKEPVVKTKKKERKIPSKIVELKKQPLEVIKTLADKVKKKAERNEKERIVLRIQREQQKQQKKIRKNLI